ncbi:MAG: uL15 family ribosomal protein [Candidatus Pacebacteria bacterium]|jgi:large subunit ribosomal protein L15|nr:uL15 family ribosomal protein [Candidatus Paceibacterota bacterium]MDD4994574.1 uL15 family ribosomal protein [Candidatus Paceibacterota bacterium]MDD5535200.1 uL15 family ribosomal protein [Candidatus Paceibacterota bacterium]
MQTHQLKKPNNKSSERKKRRIGRGGKRGTYSGKGIKGQKSRAGAKIRPQIRETVLKFPKRRGVYFNPLKKSPIIVKLENIIVAFPEGGIIDPKKLIKSNLIKVSKGDHRQIKILGAIDLSQNYTIKNCLTSHKVKEAIEKAGGKIELKNK